MTTKKTALTLYLEPNIVETIDKQVAKIGKGATRNGYLTDAIEYYLKLNLGIPFMWKKRRK